MWPFQRKSPMTAEQARTKTERWTRFWEPWEKWKADRKDCRAVRRALGDISYAAFEGRRVAFVHWRALEALVKLGYTVKDHGSILEVQW